MGPGPQLIKRKVWEAIIAGSVPALEAVIWEIITAEVHSGNCCFRKALLLSLDGSSFATEAHRNELLQRFAAQSGAGDTDAQCFIGILLCFQGGHDANEFVMPAHGVKFLHAAAERHNNLATLLLALCFECGKGVEVSTDAAKQCYNMAATRGYQMAQIFLKELVRDTTFANQQAAQQQQQQLQQMQNLQANVNPGMLGGVGGSSGPPHGGLHPGLHSTMQTNKQPLQTNLHQQGLQFSQPAGGIQGGLASQGAGDMNMAHLGGLRALGGMGDAGRMGMGQNQLSGQELLEQQVGGARKRLQAAVQDRDPLALASAINWAQEVSNATGQLTQELKEARSILNFCREQGRFPDLPGRDPTGGPSPTPSQRSNAASLVGDNLATSLASTADAGPPVTKPEDGKADQGDMQHLNGRRDVPTAAEKGEAFFQGASHLYVPLEPLETDVDKTPSEAPMPSDINLEEMDNESSGATPKAIKPGQSNPPDRDQQLASPAVAIPKKGTSSHGSIGDRRQAVAGSVAGSVADSEPPLSQHTLELFNTVTTGAGSRSAPNSHRDTFDRLSVASLSSLQPKGADGSLGPEDGKGDKAADQGDKDSPTGEDKLPRSASTRAPSPATPPEDSLRRAHSALGAREAAEGPPGFEGLNLASLKISTDEGGAPTGSLASLLSAADLETLANKGVSMADLEAAMNTSDPQKLEAYVRGLRQILQNEQGSQQNQQHGVDPPNASLVSPFGAAADQPGSATAAAANGAQPHASAPPQEDWGKLMQALHANVTGLEGEPLNDYLHNLRMLCGEDPNNDMVNPPQQSMPGIEAILGALQAQGTNPQQQQFLQAAAVAARSQNQQQLNLQLRNAGLNNLPGATQQALAQQRLGQQNLNQGLPLHLQGLGNDLANRFPGGLGQNVFNAGQGVASNPLAYSQALNNNLAARRFNQPLNTPGVNFGNPGAHDISHLLEANNPMLAGRLPNGALNARAGYGAGLNPAMSAQNPPANYDQLWGLYGNKPGAGAPGGAGLMGAGAALSGNRFAPGLPTKPKPMPADLHRSFPPQGGIPNNGLPAGLNNLSTLNTSLSGGVGNQGPANPWNAALGQANRLGNPGLGNPGLGNQPLGGALSNSSLQGSGGLQGFPSSQGLQGKPGMQGLPGSAGSLQGLQYSQGLQGLLQASQGLQGLPSNSSLQGMRLNMSNTPQPIGPPTAGQAPRSDQLTSASSYSLFKAPSNSSLHAAPSANGKSLDGSPSQQGLSENLWGNQQGSQPVSSPFATSSNEGNQSLHSNQAGRHPLSSMPAGGFGQNESQFLEVGSASSGILNKDADMQNKLRTLGSSGAMAASQGFFSQPLGSSSPPTSLAGWNTAEALQQLQNKGQARPPYYVGLGGNDSLAEAFRQRPPRPVGGPFSQPTARPATPNFASLGSLGQTSNSLMNSGANLGSGLVGSGNNLAGLGSGNLAGLGASNGFGSNLGQNLGTGFGNGLSANNYGGALNSNPAASAGLGNLGGPGRLPQNLLNAQQSRQPGRFPGL